jgi:multiple sugar transport system substrate-binding protein
MLRENPEELALWDEVFARFTQQYPTIKIDRVVTAGGTDFNDKMTSLAAAGTPIALSGPWGSGGYRVWAVQGLVAELDQFVVREKYDLSDFFPTQREFTTLQGKRYALPMAQYPQLLAYNKTLFDQAGVAYPPGWADRTWTWEQYLSAARTLTTTADPAQARWGSGNAWGDDRYLANMFGGDWFDPQAYDSGKPRTFLAHRDAVIEGLQFYADLTYSHRVRPSPEDGQRVAGGVPLFLASRVAMEAITPGVFARWSAPDTPAWGLRAVPHPPALPRKNWMYPDPWFGLTQPRHQAEQWVLLKFMASPEALRIYPLQRGPMPSRQSLFPEWREFHLRSGKLSAQDLNMAQEALQTAIPPVSHAIPLWTDVYPNILQAELLKVLRGELTAKVFVEQVTAPMEAAIGAQR